MPFRAPGRLGHPGPLPLEVTHILDEVPPHLVPDQLVAEARRAAGVPVALYVADIDDAATTPLGTARLDNQQPDGIAPCRGTPLRVIEGARV